LQGRTTFRGLSGDGARDYAGRGAGWVCYICLMDDKNEMLRGLQEDLRRAWEELDYAHLWLTASEWDEATDIDDKLNTGQQKARAYLELLNRISWVMRKG